jgi:hypothetical protein
MKPSTASVVKLSTMQTVFTGPTWHACGIAHGHNHMLCLPVKPLNYFVMNFISVWNSIVTGNGASYNLSTGELNPETGYMVASQNPSASFPMPKSLNEFQDVIQKYLTATTLNELVNSPHLYLGFWVNDGRLVIDLSENIQDKAQALVLGLDRYQLAIYDCANKCDIELRKVFESVVNTNTFIDQTLEHETH